MRDEEQEKIVAKLTRAVLMDIVFGGNALALAFMVAHDVSPDDVEDKVDEILSYLERTKEAETGG